MAVKRKLTKAREYQIDLQEAFDDFLDEKKSLNKSEATIKSYQGSFDRFYDYLEEKKKEAKAAEDSEVKPTSLFTGGTYAENMNEQVIFMFSNHLLNDEVKATSVNHYLREIRSFFYWCMEKELMPQFKIKLIKEEDVIKDTYTDEELAVLLVKPKKLASVVEWRTWAIENWIMGTGNRAETVCNITLGDLDFRRMKIRLRHTKNATQQIIPMSRELSYVLKEFIKMWRYDAGDEDCLFCNIGEEKLTVNALKHSVRDYNIKRGVNRTSIHAFRHTFAKKWILNTGDVFRLQKMLGHRTLEMTRKYVNMFGDDLKENFETYNPLDRIKKSQPKRKTIRRNTDTDDWI